MRLGKCFKGIMQAVLVAAACMCLFSVRTSAATSQLISDTPVYYANTSIYHLKGECGTLSTTTTMTLKEALDNGMRMCENCAEEAGISASKAKSLKLDDLPIKVNMDLSASSGSTSKTSSSSSTDTVTVSASDEEVTLDMTAPSTSSSTASSSSSSAKKTSTASTASSSSSSSSSSDGVLMTEKQRKNRFLSKTNPKRGEKPATIARAANAGFMYADFATFNSYASENGLGMTPVYLLGTIMEIEKVKDNGTTYDAVMMVNDCDGYQWYMRLTVAKDKYDLMKAEFLGKAGYIYGNYTGYSGVTNRPMMDPTMIFEVAGNAVNLAIYK